MNGASEPTKARVGRHITDVSAENNSPTEQKQLCMPAWNSGVAKSGTKTVLRYNRTIHAASPNNIASCQKLVRVRGES